MQKSFDEYLNKEIYKNEIVRNTLLNAVLIIFLLIFLITAIFSETQILLLFEGLEVVYLTVTIILFLIFRGIILRLFLKKRKNQNKLNPIIRYINVFIEVTIVSAILFVLIYNSKSISILASPVVLIYFLIIILTTLTIDFKISVFSGLIAAFEYYILIFYALSFNLVHQQPTSLLYDFRLYLIKGIILIMGGVLAGIVGIQIKKRIKEAFKNIEDKYSVINLFGQQVSQEIVAELTTGKEVIESKKLLVCVLFLDMRGFTKFAENKNPDQIINFQNKLFGFMIDIILKNDGIINQFLGDGYMATFGVPFSRGNDTLNAVHASLEIFNKLQEKIKKGELPETKIGIGLHTGYVVAGNVGTDQRKQYSVSGNTVIIASRIEKLNRKFNSQILVSEEVIKNIDLENFQVDDMGQVEIKGRTEPIKIYRFA